MQIIEKFQHEGFFLYNYKKNACDISQAFNSQFSILNLLLALSNYLQRSVQNRRVIQKYATAVWSRLNMKTYS